MTMAYIEIRNLNVDYGRTKAVRGISFSIPKGDVFGFIGPNGAGKTTTIKVLATLLKPSSGTAVIDDVDVTTHPVKVRRLIGYMPDTFGVYEDMTVNEYLHFFAAAYKIKSAKRKAVVGDVLALTDLTDKIDANVDSLSRGMKQRLGLARVLLHDPAFLLLDEPASGLDPRARIEVREILKELKNMGKTVLVSSHILHELAQVCTRIGIIEAGKMVAEGPLDEIYRTIKLTRTIHVQIPNLTPEMFEAIRRIDGVESADHDVDRLAVHIREEVLPVEELTARLQATGAKIYMFQPEVMDMETAFMKLTEGKTA
jgi:ABC-2 type transport system ATP-binding protein